MAALARIREIWRDNRPALLVLLAAFLFLAVATMQKRGRLTTNPVSRVATVERLVEAHTFALKTPTDSTPFPISIDHVRFGDRLYSSKPTSYPMLMAAQAWPVKKVMGWNFHAHRLDFVRMLVLLNQILPYLMGVWLCLLLLRQWGASRWTQTFLMVALTFGLLPFGYTPTINNHTFALSLHLMAFYLTCQIWEGRQKRRVAYLIVGFLGGFAFANDLTSGLLMVGMMLLLLRRNWKLTLLVAVPGLALALIPDAVGYYLINGTPLPSYLKGSAYRYPGAYWTHPEGFDALREPKWLYLTKMLLGHHGLLSLTPLLLVPMAGSLRLVRERANPLRWHVVWLAAATAAAVGYLTVTSWNYGGDCIGMRWLLHVMPFWLLLGWQAVERLSARRWGKGALVGLLLLGMPWVLNAAWDEAFIPGWPARLWVMAFGGY